jgi:hypothetical protein
MFSLIFNGCFNNNLVEMARLSFQALRHPMAGRFFFFHPRIWGPEPSSGRPGRQLSVCRGHRKRFLQWP